MSTTKLVEFLLIVLLSVFSLEAQAKGKASFVYDPITCSAPAVQVNINGKHKIWAIIDTGFTGDLLLGRQTALRCQLKPTGEMIKMGYGETAFNAQDAEIYAPVPISLTNKGESVVTSSCTPFVMENIRLLKSYSAVPVEAVIGLSFLLRHTWTFDFERNVLHIDTDNVFPSTLGKCNVRIKNNLALLDIQLNRRINREFFLDTGASTTNATSEVQKRAYHILGTEETSETLEGINRNISFLVPFITIANKDMSYVEMTASGGDIKTDNGLGMNVLSRMNFTLDLKKEEFIIHSLRKQNDTGRPKPNIQLIEANRRFFVEQVETTPKNSKKYINKGDEIVTIDGLQIVGLPQAIVGRALSRTSNKSIIEVRRGKQKLKCLFHYEPMYRIDSAIGLGFIISETAEKTLTIQSICPNSPAEKSGFREGEILISVNNIEASSSNLMNIAQMLSIKDQPIRIAVRTENNQVVERSITAGVLTALLPLKHVDNLP